MHKVTMVALALAALASGLGAEPPAPAPVPATERMKSLEFLLGRWEGEAWVQMGPGPRQSLRQREQVEWKVGGEVLLIQGRGVVSDPATGEESVVHDALAAVAWDPHSGAYEMWSYAAGRGAGRRPIEVGDRRFLWRQVIPIGEARYSMHLDEQGRWVETGEISRDGGETWQPFFGMSLTRLE